MKRRVYTLAVAISAVAGLLAWGHYPRDLDLSGAASPVIKNDQGQVAQLWWWRPSAEPKTVFHDKATGNRYGEWYSVWDSGWMINKWLKVAYIADRPDGAAKVYLLPQPGVNPDRYFGKDRFYLARRSDLAKVRPLWRKSPKHEAE